LNEDRIKRDVKKIIGACLYKWGFDDKIITLYARGMTTRDIQTGPVFA
jgi:hypothetical protein